MGVSARSLGGDTWEVSLPRMKSALKRRDGLKPRRRVHAADKAEAVRLGEELFGREYAFYKMGLTMDLAELAVFFVDHAEADGTYSPETAREYRNAVLRYVAPNFRADVDEVTALDIERLYALLLDSGGRGGRGVSAGTIHKLNTVLRATYEFLARENPAISNPMPAVELPARARPEKRALTDREFSKVLSGLEEEISRDAADAEGIARRNMMFGAYLDVHTGARVGEICALTRGDIREVERSARFEHSMSERGGLHRKEPKTRSGRRAVALDGEPWEALRRHYAWQAGYLSDAQRDSDLTPVCCTADGSFIAPSDMSRAFKEFCARVGVELKRGESIHVLRHTHATQLLSNKVNPREVQRRLGHSRIETTFGYSHVMPGEDAATAADFGEIVARARKAGGFR